jgi:hypothetical protein
MMELNVKHNAKAFIRQLDRVQRKQVPFALARALTWTAQECQKAIQDQIPKTFSVSKKWWMKQQPTGIKIKPAKKNKLWALVYTNAYFARLQEEGGIKTPLRAGKLQIPTDKVPKSRRKAGGARIMLGQKKVFSHKGGVYRKVGRKKERRVELLFWKTRTATITPRFGFKALAHKVGSKVFPEKFRLSLADALKRAR